MLKVVLITLVILFTVTPAPALTQSATYDLSELCEFSAVSYRVNCPAGWFAGQKTNISAFTEVEGDLEQALQGQFVTQGYSIVVERTPIRRIEAFESLEGDPTLEDLLAVNADVYGYQEITDQAEIEIFGVPALQVRATDGLGNATLAIQGFPAKGLAFTLRLLAPSAEKLDEFLPTWEAMLDSLWQYTGLVQVGAYNIYFNCAGTGSPPVIIEAGITRPGSFYSTLQQRVAETTLICTYNRRGTGGSDQPLKDEIRTSQTIVDELYELLGVIGVQGPYVLVGHSFGGYQVRLFADQHPDEVLGMVLIDSAHEDMLGRMTEVNPGWFNQHWEYIFLLENVDFVESTAQVAAIDSDLGDLPLIVLTADYGSPEERNEGDAIWVELQGDLAKLSTNSTHIIVEGAAHDPIRDHETTINAVIQLVEDLRGQSD